MFVLGVALDPEAAEPGRSVASGRASTKHQATIECTVVNWAYDTVTQVQSRAQPLASRRWL